ncbi:MAG: SDR family oxidoreductase [Syntrophales bacterium LBB04]|nr:SDR family oxidoreductase [Syntrophales bacterium LBB04]
MDLQLENKVALVFASSSGLGKATALEFSREGAHVVVTSRRESECRKAAREIHSITGKEPHVIPGDITQLEDIRRVVARTVELLGGIDILVNNSGGPPAGTFDQFKDEDWQKSFELNLLGYVRSIREVLPLMRTAGGGRILNYTSSSVKNPLENLILSNTFRMGVMGLTKTLAQELGKENILINVLGPGRIWTDRLKQLDEIRATKIGNTPEQVRLQACQNIPLGRYGTAEEFARLAVFLCSGANTYITGQTILVDGGMTRAY